MGKGYIYRRKKGSSPYLQNHTTEKAINFLTWKISPTFRIFSSWARFSYLIKSYKSSFCLPAPSSAPPPHFLAALQLCSNWEVRVKIANKGNLNTLSYHMAVLQHGKMCLGLTMFITFLALNAVLVISRNRSYGFSLSFTSECQKLSGFHIFSWHPREYLHKRSKHAHIHTQRRRL